MNRTALLARAAICAALGLPSPAARALEITDPVQAPPEPCTVDLSRYYQAPPALLDCTDENCGRLVPTLRDAARTADAQEILVRSAFEFYLVRHAELRPASGAVAQALADLAVTGRAAYASFRRLAPTEAALAGPLARRLQATFPAHVQLAGEVNGAAQLALTRAYQVVWALRGPTPYREAHRAGLGWIAVEAEDDPPHRPVNIPSAPFPQYDVTVRVDGTDVMTRYVVASRDFTDVHPVADLHTVPPDGEHPLIVGDVVLFIHGHSSSAEEAVTLAGPLLAQAAARGRAVTLIAMDLPSNGYASMIEPTTIAPVKASAWNSGYPILDFMEKFIIAFVDALEARQTGIKGQITAVIGGSLGGNMTLRLARRDPAIYPWLRRVVSWSPASCWPSWARAVVVPPPKGRFFDVEKNVAVLGSQEFMLQSEKPESLHVFFYGPSDAGGGRISQADHWYSPSWPCRQNAITSSHRFIYEIYNARFRRWHWRVAFEQLIYSHWDSDNPNPRVDPDPRNDPAAGPARYSKIRAKMLFASGYDDDYTPEKLFSEARQLARAMTMVEGSAFFVKDTGHSIHAEKPSFFAGRILDFLFLASPPPIPSILIPPLTF